MGGQKALHDLALVEVDGVAEHAPKTLVAPERCILRERLVPLLEGVFTPMPERIDAAQSQARPWIAEMIA
jgi:hypothetical protein